MDPVEVVNDLANELSNMIGSTLLLQKLLVSGVMILFLWWVRRFVVRLLGKQDLKAEARYRWTKIINYTVTIIGIFAVGAVWWSFVGSLATVLAVVLAGLAIALREPITNVAGWAFIMWRRPFVLGDRIEMAGVKGDVADINWFTFSLLEIGGLDMGRQPTGRVVHMPNSWVFSKFTANETQSFGFVWQEIQVVVTFESNWRKAESLLCEIVEKQAGELAPAARESLNKAAAKLLISSDPVEPDVYVRVVDIGVELTMRLVTAARKRREVEQAVWIKVLDAFAQEPDIDFAYPTQRIYLNPQEGKPGVGGPARPD